LRGKISFLLKVFYYSGAVSKWAQEQEGGVSLVPTMGALHRGHLSLVENACAVKRPVLVSIYVNPAQFNNEQDLQKYPRTLEQDLRLLQHAGADVVCPLPQTYTLPNCLWFLWIWVRWSVFLKDSIGRGILRVL
jgi:pantoate--beta-alanine ligase